MTIMKRVVDALRKDGHEAEADELQQFMLKFTGNVKDLMINTQKAEWLVRRLINVIMVRCQHHEWYLGATNAPSNPDTWGPEDTIVCYSCGHTVCDERAFAFGRRVLQGGYSVLYSKDNSRRFGLSGEIKKQLGDKLKVKEIKDGDEEERIRDSGSGNDPSETAAAVGHTEQGGTEAAGSTVGS